MRTMTTNDTRARGAGWRSVVAAAVLLAGVTGLSIGCKKESEGPMEKAGKQVDEAAEKAADDLEKASDELGEKLKGG